MLRVLCWFGKHYWFWWGVDANYRYCKHCGRWEHVEKTLVRAQRPADDYFLSLPEENFIVESYQGGDDAVTASD